MVRCSRHTGFLSGVRVLSWQACQPDSLLVSQARAFTSITRELALRSGRRSAGRRTFERVKLLLMLM